MKRTVFYIFSIFLLLGITTQLKANDEGTKSEGGSVAITESAELNKIMDRLSEIRELDIKSMTSAEKKELRKEVRTMRSELKEMSKSDSQSEAQSASEALAQARDGFYISTGAAIIIVLLLILLL